MIPAPGAKRLNAVLDTNIYIAEFAYPEGRNAAVWNAAVDGRYDLDGKADNAVSNDHHLIDLRTYAAIHPDHGGSGLRGGGL